MILFKPEHVAPILAGIKKETRRIWKKPMAKVGSIHLAKTKMLSKEFFARLKILEVRQEWLLEITDEDAIAEGYLSREAYIATFYRINHVVARGDYWVTVVCFGVVP